MTTPDTTMSAPVTSVVWYSTRQAMVRSGALCNRSVRTMSPGFPAGIGVGSV